MPKNRFKEAAEAYEVLGNEEKRQTYDRFGHAGMGNGFSGFSSNEDIFGAFSDIFGEVFGFAGAGRGGNRPMAGGSDLRYNLEISFREAAKGTEVSIQIPVETPCENCNGTGAAPGTQPQTCSHCGGSGSIQQAQGFFRISVTCPHCRGAGTLITDPCDECMGRGSVIKDKDLNVRIPAGVDNNSRFAFARRGRGWHQWRSPWRFVCGHSRYPRTNCSSAKGKILLLARKYPWFMLRSAIVWRCPLWMIPLIWISPAGTQSGEVFRLRGLGLPHLGSSQHGDLLVEIKVKIPSRLTDRQKELLEEFASIEQEEAGKFKNKAKDFFKKGQGQGNGRVVRG